MMAEDSIYAIKNHPQKQKQNTTPKKFLSKKVVNKQKASCYCLAKPRASGGQHSLKERG